MDDLIEYSEEHQDEIQKIAVIMKKGDSRCNLKIGTRVIKIGSDVGDLTPTGTKGIVIGNLHMPTEVDGEVIESIYLVKFDNSSDIKMTVDFKLRKLTSWEKIKSIFQ